MDDWLAVFGALAGVTATVITSIQAGNAKAKDDLIKSLRERIEVLEGTIADLKQRLGLPLSREERGYVQSRGEGAGHPEGAACGAPAKPACRQARRGD